MFQVEESLPLKRGAASGERQGSERLIGAIGV